MTQKVLLIKEERYFVKPFIQIIKPCIQIVQNCAKLDDTKIKQCKFHQNKSLILISEIDINEVVVSNRLCFGK